MPLLMDFDGKDRRKRSKIQGGARATGLDCRETTLWEKMMYHVGAFQSRATVPSTRKHDHGMNDFWQPSILCGLLL